MPKFTVLRAIAEGGRIEAGSVIELDEERAKNYPEGFLQAVSVVPESPAAPEPKPEVPAQPEAPVDVKPTGDAQAGNVQTENKPNEQVPVAPGPKPEVPAATVPHVVTQEDLDANPQLVTDGVKLGDTINIPADAV